MGNCFTCFKSNSTTSNTTALSNQHIVSEKINRFGKIAILHMFHTQKFISTILITETEFDLFIRLSFILYFIIFLLFICKKKSLETEELLQTNLQNIKSSHYDSKNFNKKLLVMNGGGATSNFIDEKPDKSGKCSNNI